jgi:hypothetical protein
LPHLRERGSGDGGERWELVNAHLPPIYAVSFI